MGTPILKYFECDHLPEPLRATSAEFKRLADSIEANIPGGPEKSVALRKLLEAKDAAVRAKLDDNETEGGRRGF